MRQIVLAITVALLAACTPEQLAVLEQHTGPLTPETRQTLLDMPDDVLTISGMEVHPDGSRVERKAPAGSKCPQHYGAAMRAGWKSSHWKKLDAIMWRESRCKPSAFNGSNRTRDTSYGLTQVNLRAHRSWVGPLVGWNFDLLYQPETNLRVAKVLYDKCGWGPWTKPYWCRKP